MEQICPSAFNAPMDYPYGAIDGQQRVSRHLRSILSSEAELPKASL